jgi:hypothetical protein
MNAERDTGLLDLTPLGGDSGSAVLSGKDRGERSRVDFKIDALDGDGPVDVILPKRLQAMTPSFVLGMFGRSIELCGNVDVFLDKYRFNAPAHVIDQIRRGAQFALMQGTALTRRRS